MIAAEVFAAYGKITVEQANEYLRLCDDVAELPGGALVRRRSVVHIVAPQRGLSGRKLTAATREALRRFHRVSVTLTCPIRHENTRAMRFAKFFGFKPYDATETHQWLYRHIGDPL